MAFLNKLSITTATIAAALLTVGIGTTPAQATPYKFSFTSDGANGYFIFDDSVPNTTPNTAALGEYYGSVTDYSIDLRGNKLYQGSSAGTVVYLRNLTNVGPNTPATDDFILTTQQNSQQQQFLSAIFSYPVGTLASNAEPTSVPSTTLTSGIFPSINLAEQSLGPAAFAGTFQTRIEAVPEPESLPAVFGVGACLILLHRRQLRQPLSIQKWCRVGRKSKTF